MKKAPPKRLDKSVVNLRSPITFANEIPSLKKINDLLQKANKRFDKILAWMTVLFPDVLAAEILSYSHPRYCKVSSDCYLKSRTKGILLNWYKWFRKEKDGQEVLFSLEEYVEAIQFHFTSPKGSPYVIFKSEGPNPNPRSASLYQANNNVIIWFASRKKLFMGIGEYRFQVGYYKENRSFYLCSELEPNNFRSAILQAEKFVDLVFQFAESDKKELQVAARKAAHHAQLMRLQHEMPTHTEKVRTQFLILQQLLEEKQKKQWGPLLQEFSTGGVPSTILLEKAETYLYSIRNLSYLLQLAIENIEKWNR